MSTILIKAKNLKFLPQITYPDFEIHAGEVTFIAGPSGVGKSTLLRLFNHTLSSIEGELYYRGTVTSTLDPLKLRQQILLCGQTVYLFDDTIRGNFERFYDYRSLNVPSDDQMNAVLSLCMAPFSLETRCETLSGGERQRVYIAIFASFDFDVLMLDEPTAALDAETGQKLLDNLTKFIKTNQRTLIVVSHDQALVKGFADHVLTLHKEVL